MDSLLNVLRSLGPGRLLALFLGIAAVIAIGGNTFTKLNTPSMTLLYGGLNAQETSAITQYLDSQSVAHETRGEGAVYVPADKVGELRLQVAGQGMVGASSAGYELFDNASAFGTTNFVQNLNAKRALEGELARSIATIPAVSGARVHLVMPKQNLFSKEMVEPSAAIALNLGNRTLTPDQVNSIAQLVAASVPNLTPKGVTVIDQRGTLLFDGKQNEMSAANSAKILRSIEKPYEDSLTAMLERAVGVGKVSVHVTADVNMDKVQENTESYDPTQQVVRSEQTTESSNASTDGSGNNTPTGVQGNTPGGTGSGASGGSNSNETKTETTTNYEIGKTTRSIVKEGGEIKKLSVAVLIEGKTETAQDGKVTYTPYTEDQLGRFRKLVESAIGFDAARGDKVEIVDMQFNAPPEPPAVAEPFLTKDQIMQFAQYGLMLVALIVIALLVVKPALGVMSAVATGASSVTLAIPGAPAPGALAAGAHPIPAGGEGGGATPDSLIDMKRVEGRVRESTVKKVTEIVDQHPEESLNVVRTWMSGANPQDGER